MSVRFTQYLRPSGRAIPAEIDVAADVEKLAERLRDADCALECEALTTGEVSLTIEREVEGETDLLGIDVVPNGPGVKEAVERLIRHAAKVIGVEV